MYWILDENVACIIAEFHYGNVGCVIIEHAIELNDGLFFCIIIEHHIATILANYYLTGSWPAAFAASFQMSALLNY